MTITKFTKEISTIREAFEGKTDLRSNKSLYKKICKYYKEQGMVMTGDNNLDYQTILNLLYGDVLEV